MLGLRRVRCLSKVGARETLVHSELRFVSQRQNGECRALCQSLHLYASTKRSTRPDMRSARMGDVCSSRSQDNSSVWEECCSELACVFLVLVLRTDCVSVCDVLWYPSSAPEYSVRGAGAKSVFEANKEGLLHDSRS